MRLIDADKTQAFINKMYSESQKLKDTEFMKFLVICHGIIDMQETVGPEIINEKYKRLDWEGREAVDLIINRLSIEEEMADVEIYG